MISVYIILKMIIREKKNYKNWFDYYHTVVVNRF